MGRLLVLFVVLAACLPSSGMAQATPPSPEAPPAAPRSDNFASVLAADPKLAPALALYEQGKFSEAAVEFEKLGRKGSLLAQYYMGEMLVLGLGVKADPAAALVWLQEPAQSGLAPAQLAMGQAFEAEGPQQDLDRAVALYRLASDQLPVARYRLGLMFMAGKGVESRPDLAFKLVESAAVKDVPAAELVYATMLRDGFGTRPNLPLAMEWFRKAAKHGMPNAQLVMAQAYGVGAGVPKDPSLALDWARKAAEGGNVDGQLLTGTLLARGYGVNAATDLDQAVYWLETAGRAFVAVGARNGARMTLVELKKIHPESALIPALQKVADTPDPATP